MSSSIIFRIIIFIVLITSCSQAVEYQFQLDYFPEKKSSIDDKEYDKGIYILEQTYAQIKDDNSSVTYADHLNIATAFRILNEPVSKVKFHINEAFNLNKESAAEVFLITTKRELFGKDISFDYYDSLVNVCNVILSNKQEEIFDIVAYSKAGDYNLDLLNKISELNDLDQLHRGINGKNMEKQGEIDRMNIKVIDSLFRVYKKYIGQSLVGEKFEHVMWAVVQHAELTDHKKYLPVVHEAVVSEGLDSGLLKLLIDRIYTKEYGYQIFGSQSSVELAERDEIELVKRTYGLN